MGFEQSLISEVKIGVVRISGYSGEVVVSIKIVIDFLVICLCLKAFFGYFLIGVSKSVSLVVGIQELMELSFLDCLHVYFIGFLLHPLLVPGYEDVDDEYHQDQGPIHSQYQQVGVH